MALVLKDRVKETTATTGSGTLTLAGAVAGFQSFAAIGNTNTTYYCISGQTTSEWEVGIGTYASSGTTLTRTTVLANSAGTQPTALVFSAGTKDVFCTYPSEKSVNQDAAGIVTLPSGSTLVAPVLGTPASGNFSTGTFTWPTFNQNTSGSAATLTTSRNIAGVAFNGSADIAIPLANLSDATIASPVVDQILKYNGTAWVNGNPNSVSGGSGVEFFNATPSIIATGTNNALPLLTLSQSPVTTAEQTTTTTSINGTIASSAWLSPALARTTIDAGVWTYTVFASASGATTTITRQMYAALPFVTGTLTTTGTGTTRTATASAGTPFSTSAIVASATNTLASYLQTPQGLYQISARTDDLNVTIIVPSGYANESAVAASVWKLLFGGLTSPSLTTTITQYDITTTQAAFTVTVTTKLGGISFVTSTNAGRTVTTTYNGTTRNTHMTTPLAVLHNQLGGLQGGTASEQYHLTDAEYAGTGTGVFVRAAAPTFTGTITGISGGTF